MDSELRAGEADCDRVNSNSFLYHVKQSNNSKCTTSVVDTNEANYQARLGQSSPQGVLLLPSLGLKSESHHTSVGNWVGGKKQRCATQRTESGAGRRCPSHSRTAGAPRSEAAGGRVPAGAARCPLAPQPPTVCARSPAGGLPSSRWSSPAGAALLAKKQPLVESQQALLLALQHKETEVCNAAY